MCTSCRLHPLMRLPHFALGNTKRFCFIHAGPPFAGCPRNKGRRRCPFGPVPLQSLQPYYGQLRPCVPHRYSRPCGWCPLGLLLGSRRQVPTFLTKAWIKVTQPSCRAPVGQSAGAPNLFRGTDIRARVSTPTTYVTTSHQRFTCVRLPDPHLTESCSAFFSNAHHEGSQLRRRHAVRSSKSCCTLGQKVFDISELRQNRL